MNNIAYLRKKQKMTQKELAQKSGISREAIARIETVESNPNLDTLKKIAVGLDCAITDLLEQQKNVAQREQQAYKS